MMSPHPARPGRRPEEEEGQIAPALLLVVAALIFLGLLFAQVGSASEQKTQTQTAADSAAVAATHQLRDAAVLASAEQLPLYLRAVFAPVTGWQPELTEAACAAAQRNWEANPHSAGLGCGDVRLDGTGSGVQVGVIAPPGQVVDGPAEVQGEQARAVATARVSFRRCPELSSLKRTAIAHWLADATMARLDQAADCFTLVDGMQFKLLALAPRPLAEALIGPPGEILDAVRESTRIEIID